MLSRRRIATAAVLFSCAVALRAEQVFYQIDLAPTGKVISQDLPVAKGTTIVFHRYPDGALMSMRRTEVKTLTRITPQTAQATLPREKLVQIGNLAFQGSSQAGPAAAGTASKTAAQSNGIGQGFYGNVVPGQSQGMPNSANDNQVGRTWAAPPGNAVQSAPGAPPTNSSLTNGANPPQ